MSNAKKITVDGIDYYQKTTPSNWKIVVLDRGYVVVGNVEFDGNYVVVTDCSTIRFWGTTRGLGEIAFGGPTEKTKLDAQPTTRVHELQVVQMIDCEVEKWNQ